jgi:hypothetical protein
VNDLIVVIHRLGATRAFFSLYFASRKSKGTKRAPYKLLAVGGTGLQA